MIGMLGISSPIDLEIDLATSLLGRSFLSGKVIIIQQVPQ